MPTTTTTSNKFFLLLSCWLWWWWWFLLDLRMVVGGLSYLHLVPGTHQQAQRTRHVLVFTVPSLLLDWSSCSNSSKQYPHTHTLDLCSHLRTTARTLILLVGTVICCSRIDNCSRIESFKIIRNP